MPYLWGALLGIRGFWVYYDQHLLTFQVAGTQIDPVIAAMTPALVLAMMVVAALGAWAVRRGVRYATLFPTLSLAFVLGFIVFNKVGSPQYLCWLVPSVVLGLVIDRRRWMAPASVALFAALLTQLVYPLTYNGVLFPQFVPVSLLTLRNLVLCAMFVWMVVRLVAIARRAPASAVSVRAPRDRAVAPLVP